MDFAAGAGILATLTGYAPVAAALLGALWYVIQIYESKTGQRVVTWLKLKIQRKP